MGINKYENMCIIQERAFTKPLVIMIICHKLRVIINSVRNYA